MMHAVHRRPCGFKQPRKLCDRNEAGVGENTYLLKDNFCDERSNQSAPSEAANSAVVGSGSAVYYLIHQVMSIYVNLCS